MTADRRDRSRTGEKPNEDDFANILKAALRSDLLRELRQLLNGMQELKKVVGHVAEFVVVADTNILLFEIIWLMKGRKNSMARTALEESVAAGTITVFATPQIVAEVERHLPRLAAERGLAADACATEWARYKERLLRVREPSAILTEKYRRGRDPDDASTLALADEIGADGILTEDKDIKGMGGTSIPFVFTLEARDYSRKTVVSVSIRLGGCFIMLGAINAAEAIALVVRGCWNWLRALPDPVKLIALAAALFAVVHPDSRRAIILALSNVAEALSATLPSICEVIVEAARQEARHRAPTPAIQA